MSSLSVTLLESFSGSVVDLSSSTSSSSLARGPRCCPPPWQAGGCLIATGDRILLRTHQLCCVTIVRFEEDGAQLVFFANVQVQQRDGRSSVTYVTSLSRSASDKTIVWSLGLCGIPSPPDLTWSLQSFPARAGALYCKVFVDHDSLAKRDVYRVVGVWGVRDTLFSVGLVVYAPAAWAGTARIVRVVGLQRNGYVRLQCITQTKAKIWIDISEDLLGPSPVPNWSRKVSKLLAFRGKMLSSVLERSITVDYRDLGFIERPSFGP
ncbi:hypothetical protein DFH06DRAFT_1350138 [Mycena polygramma]|nr:hypothetical protein DFH06DRAFT_1350138 [Mycena polygramma]